jgi:hypothetical protein
MDRWDQRTITASVESAPFGARATTLFVARAETAGAPLPDFLHRLCSFGWTDLLWWRLPRRETILNILAILALAYLAWLAIQGQLEA